MSSDEIKMRAVMILEIIGKPKEYLVESLEKHIGNMEKERGVTIVSKSIRSPELVKDQKDFYTTFAEVEVEVEEILGIVDLMFKYMPSHIEIISPEMLAMSNGVFNETLNELVRRLHGYDELARILQTEKQALIRQIHELGGKVPESIIPVSMLQNPFEEEELNKDEVEEAKPEKNSSKKGKKK